jgi:hypothetical protein
MSAPEISGNTRVAYMAYLNARLSVCTDEAEKAVLQSLIDEAAAFHRSASPLGTLARLGRRLISTEPEAH